MEWSEASAEATLTPPAPPELVTRHVVDVRAPQQNPIEEAR